MPPKPRLLPDYPHVYGWGAARSTLERCRDKERRELLASLCRDSGIRGAAGLTYMAAQLRWWADEDRRAPIPRMSLRAFERALIEKRAVELLRPYMESRDRRLATKVSFPEAP